MCGIAGLILRKPQHVPRAVVESVRSKLLHRGPDDHGVLVYAEGEVLRSKAFPAGGALSRVILLHQRLSILDVSASGWQPMQSADGRLHIVFNGEIYNYIELREELKREGYHFQSTSDTEVLLAAYQQWGSGVLKRLVGMFAFAILDTVRQEVFFARDQFGIKPLYYVETADGLAFASEIPALLELPGVARRVNPHVLFPYLKYGITDHGAETMFEGVRQLPAASCAVVKIGSPVGIVPEKFWEPGRGETLDLSFEEAVEHTREIFLRNVRLHMRSDVPVGAALSGGIDSSAIVASMRRLYGSELDLHTFSYVADDAALSEERWVDMAAAAAGARVHKVRTTADELVADLDALVRVQGEPFTSTSMYAQYRVFQLAQQQGIKVMLNGQGADELLAGYRFYIAARAVSLLRQARWAETLAFVRRASRLPGTGVNNLLQLTIGFMAPRALQPALRRLAGRDVAPPWMDAQWFDKHEVATAPFQVDAFTTTALREHLFQSITERNLPHLLRYEDRNSMAFSIESRVPFLTPDFAEFVLALPEEYILSPEGLSKSVFREAMRDIVPDAILDRRDKIGFVTPQTNWFRTLQPWLDRVLASDAARRIPALNLSRFGKEYAATLTGTSKYPHHTWRIVNLIAWTEQFDVQYG